MKILKIHINEFGNITNRDLDFSDGINIIEGANESGKSTLMLFIRFMLFGLPRRQKSSENISDIDRALSWKSGIASGNMTVLHNGRKYRVERICRAVSGTSRTPRDEVQIIDLATGTPLPKGDSPENLFLPDFSAEVFESSCFVGQTRCTSISGNEVGSTVENLLSSADENVNAEKIISKLDSYRKDYMHKNQKGGCLFDLKSLTANLRVRIKEAEDNRVKYDALTADIDECEKKRQDYGNELKELDNKINSFNNAVLLEKFRKLHKDENAQKELRKEIGKSEESLNGFVPDANYVTELKVASNNLQRQENRVNAATREYISALNFQESCADTSMLNSAKKAELAGGKDVLLSRIDNKRNKSGIGKILGFVFSALTVACAITGIFFFGNAAAYILFVMCALFACTAAFMFVSGAKAKKEVSEICSAFGAEYPQIKEYINSCCTAASNFVSAEQAVTEKSRTLENEKKLLDDIRHDVISLLGPMCCNDIEDIIILKNKLTETIKFAGNFCARRAELLFKLETLERTVAEEKQELQTCGHTEEELARNIPAGLENIEGTDLNKAVKRKESLKSELEALNEKLMNCAGERAALEAINENPFELAQKLAAEQERYETLNTKYNALVLAINSIRTASESLRSNVTPRIRSLANDALGRISANKYTSLGVESGLSLSVDADGFNRPIGYLSSGTRDAAYIALRLAILRLISRNNLPPLMLDETFSQLDAERSKGLLGLLCDYCSDGGQCLIFTCHTNERELTTSLGIAFELIKL